MANHEYAEKMLSQNDVNCRYENNYHYGHIILGRIALMLHDIEAAKEHLIKAGQTSGSPQLNSFGPDMTLAKELLQKGERDVVLEYFKLCMNFWDSGKKRLNKWSLLVRNGKIPNFILNLD